MRRLRELDFLRGVAIVLVFFRHQYLCSFTVNTGWIGVDLFFVLSGFLVSGLLFKEYLKFGNIRPKRFLIRRGFKIYPIYFLFYIPYLIPIIYKNTLNVRGLFSDLTFLQNYIWGWGYAYIPSWSLAIEEHFYFGFALILWLGLRHNKIILKKPLSNEKAIVSFEAVIILMCIICLFLRIYSNLFFPDQYARNFTMTHLRIDSLLAGVLISYLYYFKADYFKEAFRRHKYLLFSIAVLGLSWTPFIDPGPSFFVKTFGFTLLYISFGIVLVFFLFTVNINSKLDRLFSAPIVNMFSKVGYCSYSIYIIHSLVNTIIARIILSGNLYNNSYLNFFFTSMVSIVLGMVMTYKIESFFLRIRDKYYPSRVSQLTLNSLVLAECK